MVAGSSPVMVFVAVGGDPGYLSCNFPAIQAWYLLIVEV